MNKKYLTYYCINCGKEIDFRSKRCHSCANMCGENSPNYKDGRCLKKYYCIDCDKEISISNALYGTVRCKNCAYKLKIIPKKCNFKNQKHTIETRKKISISHKGKKLSKEHKRKLSESNKKRFENCSCFEKLIPHGKGAYYKNIWMRSSWEILFAQFLTLSNIKWKYESKTFDLGDTTYTPDFYLPEFDTYIEVKGYWRVDAKEKFNKFLKQYSQVNINIENEKSLKEKGILE